MTTVSSQIPRIYCINLKASTERRRRMEHRFSYYHLQDRVTFIDAVSREAPLIDYYHQNAVQQYPDTRKWRSEMACFASHLKAIRTFLEDGGTEALICEDDILLRNKFPEEFQKVRNNFPDDASLVSLSYMIVKWEGYLWAGKNPSLKNLCTMNPIHTWGGQLYWISQKYAIQALTMFDKPYRLLSCEHTGEVILRNSKGYICYPLLAIEEGVDSERATEDIPYHHRHFSAWGYENFEHAERVHVAPYSGKCHQVNDPPKTKSDDPPIISSESVGDDNSKNPADPAITSVSTAPSHDVADEDDEDEDEDEEEEDDDEDDEDETDGYADDDKIDGPKGSEIVINQ